MTSRVVRDPRMPGERPGWCSACGTAPCSHATLDHDPDLPPRVDLIAVLAIVFLAVLCGLFLGWVVSGAAA